MGFNLETGKMHRSAAAPPLRVRQHVHPLKLKPRTLYCLNIDLFSEVIVTLCRD